ncbi:hypothetical protein HDU87_008513 [Geranomyces variabilis]|uniref:Uncharacterized protein n=1 Tax=Geranomyces variabilis TaxID=109894 RepID=A0AAD5TNT6_9FUNG|nr:hypothetical protein HDU87_008513 [Geranomyces variabilis]
MSSNYAATDATVVAVPQNSSTTSTTAGAATTGSKILGTAERAAGHMLPGTDLGHQLKADGARLKGNEAKAEKAEAHMDHGVHESVTTGSYMLGEAERAAGHMLPGLDAGHRLKAEGAMHKGDIQKAERAAAHLKDTY